MKANIQSGLFTATGMLVQNYNTYLASTQCTQNVSAGCKISTNQNLLTMRMQQNRLRVASYIRDTGSELNIH